MEVKVRGGVSRVRIFSKFNVRWKQQRNKSFTHHKVTFRPDHMASVHIPQNSVQGISCKFSLTSASQVFYVPKSAQCKSHHHRQSGSWFMIIYTKCLIVIYYNPLTTGPLCSPAVSGWHRRVLWWPHLYHTSGDPQGLGTSQEPEKHLDVDKLKALKILHSASQTGAKTLLCFTLLFRCSCAELTC